MDRLRRVPNPEKKSQDYAGPDYYTLDSYSVAVAGNVAVEMRKRSIYEIPVYRSELTLAGSFVPDDMAVSLVRRTGKCRVYLRLAGLKGIEERPVLTIDGKEYPFPPYPEFVQGLINDGGLIPHVKKELGLA